MSDFTKKHSTIVCLAVTLTLVASFGVHSFTREAEAQPSQLVDFTHLGNSVYYFDHGGNRCYTYGASGISCVGRKP